MHWIYWVLIIAGVIILLLIILFLIGYLIDGDDEEGFLNRTMRNIRNGCAKLTGKLLRGC